MALLNLVRVVSSTTGTGTLTLGDPVEGFLSVAQAGGINATTYSYAIEADYVDGVATSREVGTGAWSSGGNTLTRNVSKSTNANNPLNLSGDAQIIITDLAEDHLSQADVEAIIAGENLAAADAVGWVKLAEDSITGTPTYVDFELPAGYKNYKIAVNQMISAATDDDYLSIQLSSNGGASWLDASDAYLYAAHGHYMDSGSTAYGFFSAADEYRQWYITGTIPYNTAATYYGADFQIWLFEPRVARTTNMFLIGSSRWANHMVQGSGSTDDASVHNAVRLFSYEEQGISNLRYTLYGQQ